MLQADPAYAVLFVVSMLFPALASIFKERIFAKEVGFIECLSATCLESHPAPFTWMPCTWLQKERLNGKDLDIFVVSSRSAMHGVASLRWSVLTPSRPLVACCSADT